MILLSSKERYKWSRRELSSSPLVSTWPSRGKSQRKYQPLAYFMVFQKRRKLPGDSSIAKISAKICAQMESIKEEEGRKPKEAWMWPRIPLAHGISSSLRAFRTMQKDGKSTTVKNDGDLFCQIYQMQIATFL